MSSAQAEVSGEMFLHTQHRYSTSHQGKIPQNGQIGILLYTHLLRPEWAYWVLKLGEHLGVGQQPNLGLGRYELELLDEVC